MIVSIAECRTWARRYWCGSFNVNDVYYVIITSLWGGDGDDDNSNRPGFDDDPDGDDEHEIAMGMDAAAMEMEDMDGMEGGDIDDLMDDMMDCDAMDIEMGFEGGDGNI